MDGGDISPTQFKGNSLLGNSSHSAALSLEPAPSSRSQAFGGALDSPAQQNSSMHSIAVAGQGDVNSQQHGPCIGFGRQAHTMEEPQRNSIGYEEPRQQSKEMSSGLTFESKHCGVEEAGVKDGMEEKFGGSTMPSGRTGGSFEDRNFGGETMGMGPGGASAVEGGQGLVKQLLVGKVHTIK